MEELNNSDGYQYYKLKDVSTDYHASQWLIYYEVDYVLGQR